MTIMNPSMRLKVKRDTFYLPDPNNGVYFRNNVSSFQMEGSSIHQWVEKLMPMFNGEYTLGYLTDGLPGPYRDRLYEIAEVLYRNGFVRDVSQDHPHQLTDQLLEKHGSQIEFVDSFVDSGAYRFQVYRETQVLAVGSGPFFVSLVSSLIESGLPKVQMLITEKVPTNRQRLMEHVAYARKTDPEVDIVEVTTQEDGWSSWRKIVQPFDCILYVSQVGDVEQLQLLHTACREEKKIFLPSLCLERVGVAGPLVHPDSDACWESAWRRMHETVLTKDQPLSGFSSTAGAMLANVIVFEMFKEITGVTKPEQRNQFFLLDLETLEGNWHPFIPHPMVTGSISARWVEDFDERLRSDLSVGEPSELLLYFNQLTSEESGIFHIWEEGDLIQLPLAQCRVQAVNPMSKGPAELLQEIISNGLTHEEVRRESGLAGIEAYVSQMVELFATTLPPHQEIIMLKPHEFIGVGAGETFEEGICRGLQKCLDAELQKQQLDRQNSVSPVHLSDIEDEKCRFYLQALTTMQGAPIIGLGEEVFGFPVVWIGTSDGWYRSVDLNMTMAIRKALQQALMGVQNPANLVKMKAMDGSSVILDEKEPQSILIPACDQKNFAGILPSAMKTLKRDCKRLLAIELEMEPFMKEKLAGVFGVCLREEESR